MTASRRAALTALLVLCLAVAAVQTRPHDAAYEDTDNEYDDDEVDAKTTPETAILNSAAANDDAAKAQTPSSVTPPKTTSDAVENDADAKTEATPAKDAASRAKENDDKMTPQSSPAANLDDAIENADADAKTTLPLSSGVILRNFPSDPVKNTDADTNTTLVESDDDDDVIWPRNDGRRRNDAGDIVIEDTDDAVVEDRLEGVMPSMPPDEDPATVFAPWTIAVIACVGAIIVAVVAYYVWQRWTEIRSCCCGGEYSQP